MTPVLGIIASSNQQGRNNYDPGSYFSIASTTVSSPVASFTFSNIPTGYQNLQIRYSALTARTTYAHDGVLVRFNGDTAANYSYHILRGRGSGTPDSGGGPNETSMYFDWGFGTTVISSPAGAVFDILDYANTSKAKTLRGLYGVDTNGSVAGYVGSVTLCSGSYFNSSYAAINSITLTSANGFNIAANSKFSLYGVK